PAPGPLGRGGGPRPSRLLNVGRGGDLAQHLPDVVGDDKHRHTPGAFADHDVTLEPGTRLAELLGEHTPVKSHHHQGSAASARDCASRRTRRTEWSRRSRIRRIASPSACSGIRRSARTASCSTSSSRPPPTSGRRASGSGSSASGPSRKGRRDTCTPPPPPPLGARDNSRPPPP